MQISVTADAPLLFWSLLSAGVSRKTPIAVQALAGVSAPLCTACGIEPFAIAAKDASDLVNFGLGDPTDPTLPTNYTFYYNCTGTTPAFLPNSGQSAPYTIINRYDAASTTVPDETDQLFRLGASGLMSSTTPNPTGSTIPMGCAGIGDPLEAVWSSPTFTAVPPPVCGGAAPGGRGRAVRPVFAGGQHDLACRLHHRRSPIIRRWPAAAPVDTDPGDDAGPLHRLLRATDGASSRWRWWMRWRRIRPRR